jgi:GMP reductase
MRIEDDLKLDYDDVLLRPKRSQLDSRSAVNLWRKFKFPHSILEWRGIPVVASNMDTIGTFKVAEVLYRHNMLTCIHKYISWNDWKDCELSVDANDYLAVSMGAIDNGETTRILDTFLDIPFICLDVANGYSDHFSKLVTQVRTRWPDRIIIAGNVVTAEMTEQLIIDGADIVKVGIGPGSVCTTRDTTGVGYPQLSAIVECADAAHGLNGHIMSDGGCKSPGDVAKAFAAGADFVMIGGMFSGTNETGYDFYGMSSRTAQELYHGEVASYRAVEGKHIKVESKGKLDDVVKQILGGLRSACTYIGASELRYMPKCSTFIRVNRAK